MVWKTDSLNQREINWVISSLDNWKEASQWEKVEPLLSSGDLGSVPHWGSTKESLW